MKLGHYVRVAVERRLASIEHGLRDVEGLIVTRGGDAIHVHARRLGRRLIEDMRLRFAGLGQ